MAREPATSPRKAERSRRLDAPLGESHEQELGKAEEEQEAHAVGDKRPRNNTVKEL